MPRCPTSFLTRNAVVHLQVEDMFHLENLHLSVKVNSSGNIVSLVHKGTGRYYSQQTTYLSDVSMFKMIAVC